MLSVSQVGLTVEFGPGSLEVPLVQVKSCVFLEYQALEYLRSSWNMRKPQISQ